MDKPRKEEEVAQLTEALKGSAAHYWADYRGMTVEEMTAWRSDLKQNGAVGKVVKNTLAKIAVNNAFAENEGEASKVVDILQGPSFLICSESDPISPAKSLAKFAKSHEALEIKGGWFEGAFLDVDAVKKLSQMPSKDELYAKLLSVLSAPATKLVRTMQEPASRLVRLLEAYRAKKESEG